MNKYILCSIIVLIISIIKYNCNLIEGLNDIIYEGNEMDTDNMVFIPCKDPNFYDNLIDDGHDILKHGNNIIYQVNDNIYPVNNYNIKIMEGSRNNESNGLYSTIDKIKNNNDYFDSIPQCNITSDNSFKYKTYKGQFDINKQKNNTKTNDEYQIIVDPFFNNFDINTTNQSIEYRHPNFIGNKIIYDNDISDILKKKKRDYISFHDTSNILYKNIYSDDIDYSNLLQSENIDTNINQTTCNNIDNNFNFYPCKKYGMFNDLSSSNKYVKNTEYYKDTCCLG